MDKAEYNPHLSFIKISRADYDKYYSTKVAIYINDVLEHCDVYEIKIDNEEDLHKIAMEYMESKAFEEVQTTDYAHNAILNYYGTLKGRKQDFVEDDDKEIF